MKIKRYQEFLGMMRPWEWPESFFAKPEKVRSLALAVQEYAGGFFRDVAPTDRPLGLMTVRLLWELAVLTHDKRRRQEVSETFLHGDEVTFYWSLATPWGITTLTDEQADNFLKEAVVMGDAALTQSWIMASPGTRTSKPVGLRSRRAFDAVCEQGGDALRAMLGESGATAKRTLIFAVRDDRGVGLFPCGTPWFGPLDDLAGARPVKIPGALSHIAPEVYEQGPNGSATRYFLPGSEAGAQIELEGHAALDPRGLGAVPKAFSDSAPSVRVQFTYLPGWNVVPYGLGADVMTWSDLTPDAQEEIEIESGGTFLL